MSQPSRHAYWTPENRPPEEPSARPLGSSPEAARSVVDSGLKILDNNDQSVAVATHIGKDYSLSTEAAYVRIQLPEKGRPQVARITAAREAEFARGTGALQDALRQAERLAADHGAVVLTCESAPGLGSMDNETVTSVLDTLQDEGYQVIYRTRLADGRSELIFPQGSGREKIVGTVESFDCKKNLLVTPPEAPERGVYIRDLDERKLLEQLSQIEKTGKAPEQLDLPPAVQDALAKLWADSIQPGSYREAGAYLVLGSDGRVKMGPESRGELLSVANARGAGGSVIIEPPLEGDQVVGQMHTHPYLDGLDGMSFSGQDVVSLLLTPESHVSLVRSGDTVFALVRTSETKIPKPQELELIRRGVQADYEIGCLRRGARWPDGQATFQDLREAALDATVGVCQERHLALYAGQAGQPLKRIYP